MKRKDMPKECINGERHSWEWETIKREKDGKELIEVTEHICLKCGVIYHSTHRGLIK